MLEIFLAQNKKHLTKGKLKLEAWDENIVRLAIKFNKTITEIMQEPFEYVLAIHHTMSFDEEMKLGTQLIEYFNNQNQQKK